MAIEGNADFNRRETEDRTEGSEGNEGLQGRDRWERPFAEVLEQDGEF